MNTRALRRKADAPELKFIERPFELKSLADDGSFTGYGSVFGNVDAYKEIVAPGAFADSLAAWKTSGLLPPVLWQHRAGEPLGPYLEMREDSHGLFVHGQLLVNDVARAREARALMKAKAVNGLSIGFLPREETYDRLTGITTLTKIDLWEISVVTFPANPAAQISSVKSRLETIRSLSDAELYLRESGLSKAEARALVGRIKSLSSGRSESDEELGDLVSSLQRLQATLI